MSVLEGQCPICMDRNIDVELPCCTYKLCTRCLNGIALQQGENARVDGELVKRCPQCRREFKQEEIIDIMSTSSADSSPGISTLFEEGMTVDSPVPATPTVRSENPVQPPAPAPARTSALPFSLPALATTPARTLALPFSIPAPATRVSLTPLAPPSRALRERRVEADDGKCQQECKNSQFRQRAVNDPKAPEIQKQQWKRCSKASYRDGLCKRHFLLSATAKEQDQLDAAKDDRGAHHQSHELSSEANPKAPRSTTRGTTKSNPDAS